MNELVGRVIQAKVTDANDKYYFVQLKGVTFQLLKSEMEAEGKELHIGGLITGFAYENGHHQMQITRKIPKVQIGHYAWGEVVAQRRDLGVFVDIGLPDKDIVVSLDNLPTIPALWPQKGDKLMVSLRVDEKGRLWAQLADEQIFKAVTLKAKQGLQNMNVTGTVFRLKMVGTFILTDDYYMGFVFPGERDKEPRLGEVVNARVIGVRPDGLLNLSLKPRAYEAIGEDAQMLLAMLEHSKDNTLPFSDKSDPKEIKEYFGISKGQFKRAVGNLLKQRRIQQVDGTLVLVPATTTENTDATTK
ncbi:CvfB family protein [Periweissella ghanensis]|uniref:Conserved virulence factor B n=1 Tax=Periweissella ghanensis TaxID=467997 RepID=A0ABM8Z9V4_9LACO|nr:S1-like domain-containing RNA-binding protein [Periweissella ghanensis]MCM0600416.1 DNA-binding protein [Periweissella ghanensis]CAH0418120.1 Conserved virulence factor B [Periweissella ghanensis]